MLLLDGGGSKHDLYTSIGRFVVCGGYIAEYLKAKVYKGMSPFILVRLTTDK